MSPILTALNSGYSPKKILDYISKIDPQLALKINTAMQSGYGIEQVLNYLQRQGEKVSSFLKPKKEEEHKNIYQHAQKSVHPALQGMGQAATTLLGGSLGAYALSRSLPQAAKALIPEILPAAETAAPQAVEQVAQQISPAAIQSAIPKPPLQIPQALSKTLEALLNKNPPETAAAVLKKQNPQIVKEWEKEAGMPFEEGVKEFAKTYQAPQQPQQPPQTIKENISISPEGDKITSEKMEPKFGQIPSGSSLEAERPQEPEIKQKKLVSLPDGTIGELMNVRKGIAEVNQEGKIRRRKESELIESPLPEKDLGELYGELIQKIPESERSSNINVAAYDANSNSLLVRFHNGAYYVYENIDQEFADKLKNSMFQAKTTGENFFGAWSKGEGSRGAGLYALIKDLQKHYGGKGKEYSRKYETIHSLLGLAEKAHKEKLDEQKKRKRQLS